MEHLKIAIADDNQKILDLLDYAENGWIDGYGPNQS